VFSGGIGRSIVLTGRLLRPAEGCIVGLVVQREPRVSGPSRAALHETAVIPATAEQVWELICDWAGMLRWWLPAERGGLQGPTLVGCELLGAPTAVPRTRRMTLSSGIAVEETVVYQNDRTRRIHYVRPDDATATGYAATTYVDDLSGGGCLVHISSAFDVLYPDDGASSTARFRAVYAAMFRGYRDYFSRQAV
jgi:hypothetical protein